MGSLSELDLDSLPPEETDEREYKQSSISQNDLRRELQNAASAFWNTGGGILLAGVADNGTVDGGIPDSFGRQSLRDWVDQVLAVVRPVGQYESHVYTPSECASIRAGNCVLAVQFCPSSFVPHQSPDRKYYIRAGAHTVPASHDLVDALYAKRHFQKPRLVHLARFTGYTTKTGMLILEIVGATDSVAIDVEIDFAVRPPKPGNPLFPIVVPIIDREHSFTFRFQIPLEPVFKSELKVDYRDLMGHEYSYTAVIDASSCISTWHEDYGVAGQIVGALRELTHAVRNAGFRFQ